MDYVQAHKHKLHRRQRGPPALGEDIPGITTATLASPIAALPTTAATGPGRGRGPTSDDADTPIRAGPGREPEDDDEDGDESTGMLSSW